MKVVGERAGSSSSGMRSRAKMSWVAVSLVWGLEKVAWAVRRPMMA